MFLFFYPLDNYNRIGFEQVHTQQAHNLFFLWYRLKIKAYLLQITTRRRQRRLIANWRRYGRSIQESNLKKKYYFPGEHRRNAWPDTDGHGLQSYGSLGDAICRDTVDPEDNWRLQESSVIVEQPDPAATYEDTVGGDRVSSVRYLYDWKLTICPAEVACFANVSSCTVVGIVNRNRM